MPQWQGIDITAELERHWDQHGGLPALHHRLQACLLHIGLDAMAYNAYRAAGMTSRAPPARFQD